LRNRQTGRSIKGQATVKMQANAFSSVRGLVASGIML